MWNDEGVEEGSLIVRLRVWILVLARLAMRKGAMRFAFSAAAMASWGIGEFSARLESCT